MMSQSETDLLKSSAVIILNHDTADLVYDLAMKIVKEIPISIIIIDNSLHDEQSKILKSIQERYSNVTLRILSANYGYSHGNNAGIEIARNSGKKFAIICNPDIAIEESKIAEVFLSLLRKTSLENIILAGPAIINENSKLNRYQSPKYRPRFFWLFTYNIFYPLSYLIGKVFRNLVISRGRRERRVFMVQGSFFALDIEKMGKIGFFPEKVFLTHEEEIIGLNILETPFRVIFDPSIHVFHNHSASFSKNSLTFQEEKFKEGFNRMVDTMKLSEIERNLLVKTMKWRLFIARIGKHMLIKRRKEAEK